MISCLPVSNNVNIFLVVFFVFFCLLFLGKLNKVYNTQNNTLCFQDETFVTKAWLNIRKQLVLADSLFMRIQPSIRFYIMETHRE